VGQCSGMSPGVEFTPPAISRNLASRAVDASRNPVAAVRFKYDVEVRNLPTCFTEEGARGSVTVSAERFGLQSLVAVAIAVLVRRRSVMTATATRREAQRHDGHRSPPQQAVPQHRGIYANTLYTPEAIYWSGPVFGNVPRAHEDVA
jgi:hypothetical protein